MVTHRLPVGAQNHQICANAVGCAENNLCHSARGRLYGLHRKMGLVLDTPCIQNRHHTAPMNNKASFYCDMRGII